MVEVDLSDFFKTVHETAKKNPEYEIDHDCNGVHTQGTRIGYVPTSKGLFILNQEGCGPETEEPVTETQSQPIPLYQTYKKVGGRSRFSIAPFASVSISHERLIGFPVIGVVNLGEWVRKFGDRLERNFHNWNNFLTPIYDKEHVQALVK